MLVEWVLFDKELSDQNITDERRNLIMNMVKFFTDRNYVPYGIPRGNDLSAEDPTKWTYNVIFKLRSGGQ